MGMERISKDELARRLEARVECAEGGEKGLETLLYGWKKHRHFGEKYRHALNARDYLFITEVLDLTEYIGYDLSKKSSC